MTEYKIIKCDVGYPNQAITEDGHTMFIEDVLYRLKRLDFLEKWKSNIDAENKTQAESKDSVD